MQKSINHLTSLVLETFWGLSCVFKIWQKNFLDALPNLLPTTPSSTLEIWLNVNFVCAFDILMFLPKNWRFRDYFSLRQFLYYKKQNWVALFWSLPCILEILINIFVTALHSVPWTTILEKKAIFVRFRRSFIVGTKNESWDKSYRFRDINCRFKDKSPF